MLQASPESIGLNWILGGTGGSDEIWHNGGTGGSRSLVAFDPKQQTAVVILANSAISVQCVEEIVFGKECKPNLGVTLSEPQMAALIGKYDFGGDNTIEVKRKQNFLYSVLDFAGTDKATGRMYAKNELEFFLLQGLAELTFKRESSGEISGATLMSSFFSMRHNRIFL